MLKLKTENWKYCSKIIFKCVNSVVRPIFNEKIDKKWNLWVRKQCTDALFTEDWSKVVATVHVQYMNSSRLLGKGLAKKKKKENVGNLNAAKRNVDSNWALERKRDFFFFWSLNSRMRGIYLSLKFCQPYKRMKEMWKCLNFNGYK